MFKGRVQRRWARYRDGGVAGCVLLRARFEAGPTDSAAFLGAAFAGARLFPVAFLVATFFEGWPLRCPTGPNGFCRV